MIKYGDAPSKDFNALDILQTIYGMNTSYGYMMGMQYKSGYMWTKNIVIHKYVVL
jgi:hypothetical protein